MYRQHLYYTVDPSENNFNPVGKKCIYSNALTVMHNGHLCEKTFMRIAK